MFGDVEIYEGGMEGVLVGGKRGGGVSRSQWCTLH